MKRVVETVVAAGILTGVGCVAQLPAPLAERADGATSGPTIGLVGGSVDDSGGSPAGSGDSGLGTAAGTALDPVAGQGPAARRGGALVFAIRWPARVQAIPAEANAIVISVDSAGANLARRVITRPQSGFASTSTESIAFESPISGLTVTAKAYSSTSPADGDPVLALAASTSVTVADGTNTDVRLTLAALGSPVISRLDPANGGVGATASAVGTGFGLVGSLPYTVDLVTISSTMDLTPGSTRSASGSEEVIEFAVPLFAAGGNIQVQVSGKPSNSKPFQVISVLRLVQRSLTVSKTAGPVQLTPSATDSQGVAVTSPAITWELLDGVAATNSSGPIFVGLLSKTGQFTPDVAGTASIRVFSGLASDTIPVTVTN